MKTTMTVGIVGSEAAKFTPETEAKARRLIQQVLSTATRVVSGACHLGGIDQWAEEEAAKLGLPFTEFRPATRQWSGGYKERNLKIAQFSDVVYCITVKELPPNYTGTRFALCYHCGTDAHVKSGGCWTVKQAKKFGKPGQIIVIGEATPQRLCGAVSGIHTCDRDLGHTGSHRAYFEQHDEVVFWIGVADGNR